MADFSPPALLRAHFGFLVFWYFGDFGADFLVFWFFGFTDAPIFLVFGFLV